MTDNQSSQVKAVRIEEYGGPEVLKVKSARVGQPGERQALVRIHAAGLNFIDIYRRRGDYPVDLPYTPGLEASGVVEAIGPAVDEVKIGARVAYTGQPGAYAEAALVDARYLIAIPDTMSYEEGASFPLQGMTAHYLINEYRPPKPGMRVLIHAAAGGMGLLLCQWAKHLGAEVIGTVSTREKAELASQAGCDHVILYSEQDFSKGVKNLTDGEGVDLIIDGVGKSTFEGNLETINVRGTIVIFGSASGRAEPISPNVLQQKSVRLCGGSLFHHMNDRDEILTRAHDVLFAIKAGWLKLRHAHEFKLDQVQEAHRLLESRKSTGKVILTIN
ncbi:MAG: quinone oxidoreductase [Candidatus Obscuribacterales bacterium]|nr:quinone oxidoreductase [Candidatus Obscuribacterales bacterium]